MLDDEPLNQREDVKDEDPINEPTNDVDEAAAEEQEEKVPV